MALITSYGIHKDRNSMEGLAAYENGGKGSGNFGHSGRPGEVGGSAPSGNGGASGSSKGGEKKKYTKADLINDEYKEGYITAGERDTLLKKAQEDGSATESAEPFKDKKSESGKAHSNKKSQESATEWAKKNFTSGEGLPSKDMSFDELLARMVDGEDYYELMGSDSVDREAMFSEMANRTGLEYDDIYKAWMGDMGGQSRRYTDELKKSPRLRDLDRLNESGFQHWQKTGKQDLLLGTKEHDERNLRDMVRSTWTYGGGKDSEYLHDGYRSLSDKERKKIIDDEWKYLDDNCTTAYAGTDSEGGSYRSIKYRPSSKKKKNSLEEILTDAIDKILNGGKGSGNFGHGGRPGEVGGSSPKGSYPRNLTEAKKKEKEAEKEFSDYVESHKGADYDQKVADKLGAKLDDAKEWRQGYEQDEAYEKMEKKDKKESKTQTISLKGKSLYEKVHTIEPGDEVHITPKDNLPNFDRKIKVDYIEDGTIHYGGSETSDGQTYPAWAIKDITKIVRKKKNELELNGGKGSGNFGHSGRPGEVGGSAPSGSHSGSSGRTKEELQDEIEDLNTRISQAGVAQKKGEKVDEGYIQDMMEERKALRAELDSMKSQPEADEDENLPSSYTGKNVSLEYTPGDHQHRPTHTTTTPEDTGYGEFVELGDGKIGVKTTMSAEDTHDSIKALFETELAKFDEPRAKADGFLNKDLEMVVSDRTYDDFQDASKHLERTAETLQKYIKEVQGHSTSVHARGTKPGNIEEKMRQAKSLTDQWGKKLKSNPEMPKEALAKYQRRADTIEKSYETIKKIAERTPEYIMGMGPDSYRTHDVTADFDRPMTRAMAEREMKDMRAR